MDKTEPDDYVINVQIRHQKDLEDSNVSNADVEVLEDSTHNRKSYEITVTRSNRNSYEITE